MTEERKMVLQMLENNKISVHEATKLLQALGEPNNIAKPKTVGGSEHHSSRKLEVVNTHSIADEIKREVKQAVQEAKAASKEALVEAREAINEAIKEGREAINTSLGGRTPNKQLETLRKQSPLLAEQLEDAEQQFSEAKQLLIKAKKLEENQASEGEEGVDAQVEELTAQAQQMAKEAEAEMLRIRKDIKEQGIEFDLSAANNGQIDFWGQFEGNMDKVGDVIANVTSQIGPMIAQTINGLGLNIGSDGIELTEKVEGQFANPSEKATVNVAIQNGRIRIIEHNEKQVTVHLRHEIRGADNKETAKEIAEKICKVDFVDNVLNIEVKKQFGGRHSVYVTVYLPQGQYDCNLNSINGKIELKNITADQLMATTVNGKIIAEGGSAQMLRLASTNGKIIAQTKAPQTEVSATNGKISFTINPEQTGQVALQTVNGKISIEQDPTVPAELTAQTGFGNIRVPEEWQVVKERTQRGSKSLEARSTVTSEAPSLRITAKTTHGNIRVS